MFLIIVFLGAWAGGLWIRPFGPTFYDVAWVPFLIAGLVIALLLAASASARYPRPRNPAGEAAYEGEIAAAFGIFFWLVLVGPVVTVVLSYV